MTFLLSDEFVLLVLAVLAVFCAGALVLPRRRRRPRRSPGCGLPVQCGYCSRWLGNGRLGHGGLRGIHYQGGYYCDRLCASRAEARDMNERSLRHRG